MTKGSPVSRDQFARTVALVAGLESFEPDQQRQRALLSVLEGVDRQLQEGAAGSSLLTALPDLFHAAMKPFGWQWNGIYFLGPDDRLQLGPAHGPPVCAELERSGGPLSSGMCFDSLLLNQTLLVPDVKSWPGYVSCDAESGLRTLGGITCPVRDPEGHAFGVWDVDSTQAVTAGDGRFVEALFSTLAQTIDLRKF